MCRSYPGRPYDPRRARREVRRGGLRAARSSARSSGPRIARSASVPDRRSHRSCEYRLFHGSSSGNHSALRAGLAQVPWRNVGVQRRHPECAARDAARRQPPGFCGLKRATAGTGGPSVGRTLRPASSERGTTRGDGVPTVKRGHCGEVQRDHRLHGRQRARHRRDRTRPARLRVARLRQAALEPADGSGFRPIWFIRRGCGNSHGRFPVGVYAAFDSRGARAGRGVAAAAIPRPRRGSGSSPFSVLPVTRCPDAHRARPASRPRERGGAARWCRSPKLAWTSR